MNAQILSTGYTPDPQPRTMRQRMNAMSADLVEQAAVAREAGANLLADVLLMARSNILEAESILAGYSETLQGDDKPEQIKTNGVFTP